MEKVRFAQEYKADGYLKQQLRELKTKQQEINTNSAFTNSLSDSINR